MAGLVGRLCSSCSRTASVSARLQTVSVSIARHASSNPKMAKAQKGREQIVVRVAEGSLFMSMFLTLNGKSRMLNRVRTDAFEKTLHRIGLVSSVVSGEENYDEDHPVALVHGRGERAGLPKESGTSNIDAFREGDVLAIGDKEFVITVNPPSVLGITFPSYISKGSPIYPSIQAEFVKDDKLRYVWRRIASIGTDGGGEQDDVAVSTEASYTPVSEDVGCRLALTVTPAAERGEPTPSSYTATTCDVDSDMLRLGYVERALHTAEFHAADSDMLRVVTYNVLAEMYLADGYGAAQFEYCANKALLTGYRDMILSRELPAYHADILCLQEVEERRFQNTIMACLRSLSYQGKTVMKHNMSEGLATVWRTDRFQYRDTKTYVVRDEFRDNPLLQGIVTTLPSWMRGELRLRNTVLQLTHLQQKSDGRDLIVCNTHLYYQPMADGQRLVLALAMLKLLAAFKESVVAGSTSLLPAATIFCGDLNSIPERSVHQLFTTGSISATPGEGRAEPNRDGLAYACEHPQTFGCALPHESVPWSNYTHPFVGLLDYIYYDETALELHRLVPMPREDVVREFTALPSVRFCSDHLPVINDLKFKQTVAA